MLTWLWKGCGENGAILYADSLQSWVCFLLFYWIILDWYVSTEMIVLCVPNVILLCLLIRSYFCHLFFFFPFPPTYPDLWLKMLFHSPSVYPRAITCDYLCQSFSIRISHFFLILFELSCLSLRLSSRIRLDICPGASDLVLWDPFSVWLRPLSQRGLSFIFDL